MSRIFFNTVFEDERLLPLKAEDLHLIPGNILGTPHMYSSMLNFLGRLIRCSVKNGKMLDGPYTRFGDVNRWVIELGRKADRENQ